MKKALMIGAMAVAAVTFGTSNSAQAATATYTYGFESPSGGEYCDGVDLTANATFAYGTHVYYQYYCPYKNLYVGGYAGTAKGLGKGTWYSLLGSQDPASGLPFLYADTFYINLKAKTWAVAIESSYYGIPFELINSGILGTQLSAKSPKAIHGSAVGTAIQKMRVQGKLK